MLLTLAVLLSIVAFSLWAYSRFSAQKPRIYVAPASWLERSLKESVPCLHEVYHPTWWCPFGTLQTIARQLFRSRPPLPFDREIVTYEDGGQAAIDWMKTDHTNDESPVVVFLPGICGSTYDCAYILHAVIECNKLHYRSVVINPRGLGGVTLKTAQTYNAAWTSDLSHVIGLISERFSKAPKIAVGFSMGGIVLWNYLAECASAQETGLCGALCVSSPFNPFQATTTIEKFFPRIIFNSALAQHLKNLVKPYKTMFEGRCNWAQVMASRTVREFDAAFTVPTFGYRDVDEYYQRMALYSKVHQIPVPTLCLNSVDDCFSPLKSIPFSEVVRSDNVAVAITQHGGHTAFMRETHPEAPGLVEDLIVQYAAMLFAN